MGLFTIFHKLITLLLKIIIINIVVRSSDNGSIRYHGKHCGTISEQGIFLSIWKPFALPITWLHFFVRVVRDGGTEQGQGDLQHASFPPSAK